MEGHSDRKRVRDDSGNSEHDSADVKKLREDLIDFLDETDAATYPSIQDLDSVLRSLEQEISAPFTESPASDPVPVVDLTLESGESQPNLGYLLEASDDELGLPPSINSIEEESKPVETELIRVPSGSSGIDDLWGLELDDQVQKYGSFDLATAANNEFVSYDDELFGYSDVYFDSSQYSDFSWRYDTLPAQ